MYMRRCVFVMPLNAAAPQPWPRPASGINYNSVGVDFMECRIDYPMPAFFNPIMAPPMIRPGPVQQQRAICPAQVAPAEWADFFGILFSQFLDHAWTLESTEHPPVDDCAGLGWSLVTHMARVRFGCQSGHVWVSARGRVSFWFRLRRCEAGISGQVLYKVYGQRCERCSPQDCAYNPPLWDRRDMINAVQHLHNKVGQRLYGLMPAIECGCSSPPPTGGPGWNPHKATLFQACMDGICRRA